MTERRRATNRNLSQMRIQEASPTKQQLTIENQELRARLEEAQETLRAIRSGEVDALVVQSDRGEQVFTLTGADRTYRILIERMNEGALSIAVDGTILYANRRFAEMLQTPLEKVIGSLITDWIAPSSQADLQKLMGSAASGAGRAELMLAAANRSILPAYFSASAMALDGTSAILGVVATDLTERKQAEEEIRLLNRRLERRIRERTAQLNSSNTLLSQEAEEREKAQAGLESANQRISEILASIQDGFLALDQDWRILYINRRAAQNMGHAPEELLGMDLWESLPGIARTPFKDQLMKAVEERSPTWFETEGVLTPGIHEVRVSPLADGISIFLIDITERARSEAEIQRLNDDLVLRARALEAANKDLEAFSYSVSHDLRAPLRHMDGLSHMVVEKYKAVLPEQGREYLNMMRENVEQMGRLLDALLALSRSSRQPLSIQEVLPAVLVRRVIEELQPEDENRQIEFTVGDTQAAPEQALPLCMADPDLLKQVYTNLISNAVKFTRRCPVAQIEIGATHQGDQLVYYVKDNGAGFDMQYASKLFGVFQRLHSDTEYEGTGVGLAIVQRIIRRHGGEIWAEAEEGRGATFYFTLPEA